MPDPLPEVPGNDLPELPPPPVPDVPQPPEQPSGDLPEPLPEAALGPLDIPPTPSRVSAVAIRGPLLLDPSLREDTGSDPAPSSPPIAARDRVDSPKRISSRQDLTAGSRDCPPLPAVSPNKTRPALLALEGVVAGNWPAGTRREVSFGVPTGSVTLLMGRRGAGKTSLLRAIMGLGRARAGRVVVAGHDITGWSPPRIARLGVGYLPENSGIFGNLSVAENMALAVRDGRHTGHRLDQIFALFPALRGRWKLSANALPDDQKLMLALARLMAEEKRLCLIDTPSRDLAPQSFPTLVAALSDLKGQGVTVLLAGQDLALAEAVGDRAVVMESGGTVWNGTMKELAGDVRLQDRLMGFETGAA